MPGRRCPGPFKLLSERACNTLPTLYWPHQPINYTQIQRNRGKKSLLYSILKNYIWVNINKISSTTKTIVEHILIISALFHVLQLKATNFLFYKTVCLYIIFAYTHMCMYTGRHSGSFQLLVSHDNHECNESYTHCTLGHGLHAVSQVTLTIVL